MNTIRNKLLAVSCLRRKEGGKGQFSLDATVCCLALLLLLAAFVSTLNFKNRQLENHIALFALDARVNAAADYAIKYHGAVKTPSSVRHHVLSEWFATSTVLGQGIAGFENTSARILPSGSDATWQLPSFSPAPDWQQQKNYHCVTRLAVFEGRPAKLEVCGW
ncbi:hypothetical protein FJZ26_01070 [Candidatus Parvarchaeota archaeon]|nr:hypothetical protein [Candidatus Parvarchaeota archaeon]